MSRHKAPKIIKGGSFPGFENPPWIIPSNVSSEDETQGKKEKM